MQHPTPRNEGQAAQSPWHWGSLFLAPIRWVTGFMFLSAFMRRMIQQPAKMDPTSPAWNGRKFAEFVPHAIGIKPMLSFLVLHPGQLQTFLIVFTILEGLVGLFLITGFMTRLSALGSAMLSFGILLGSGWLGSTCLDEWQIGVILTGTGLVIAFAGSGSWSVDGWLLRRRPELAATRWFPWLFSGAIISDEKKLTAWGLGVGALAVFVMLWSYQVIHGGLWGGLHNESKAPNLVLSRQEVQADGQVRLNLYRDGGPDTYGSFVVEVQVKDAAGKLLEDFKADQLAKLRPEAIQNHQTVEKVRTGPYGLVVPLSGDALVTLGQTTPVTLPAGTPVSVTVFDVSGTKWTVNTKIQP